MPNRITIRCEAEDGASFYIWRDKHDPSVDSDDFCGTCEKKLEKWEVYSNEDIERGPHNSRQFMCKQCLKDLLCDIVENLSPTDYETAHDPLRS